MASSNQKYQPKYQSIGQQSSTQFTIDLEQKLDPKNKQTPKTSNSLSILQLVIELIFYDFKRGINRFFYSLYILQNQIYYFTKASKKFIFHFFICLFEIITDPDVAKIRLTNLKTDCKNTFKNLIQKVAFVYLILQKCYLLIVVLTVIIGLKISATYGRPNPNHKSFISKVFDNYSFLNNQNNNAKTVTTAITTKNKQITDQFPLNKVIVKAGDTIEKIAQNEDLVPESILLNNNIEPNKPLPKELIVPWQDGYIIFPNEDIKPKEIADKYKVDEKLLYSFNEDKINYETGKFVKGSIIIIPTKDLIPIKKIIEEEKNKLATEEKMKQEKENQLKLAKSYQDQFSGIESSLGGKNSNKYIDSVSEYRASAGFIWPTKGSISRCIEPGHPGCDIANSSMPPVYAVQDGTIADVYRYTVYGYGNAVVIDHGNGLKTLYAHLNEIYVNAGQPISQGQAIGQMGNTGNSTGTHLHFEVIQNKTKQNPLNYLP